MSTKKLGLAFALGIPLLFAGSCNSAMIGGNDDGGAGDGGGGGGLTPPVPGCIGSCQVASCPADSPTTIKGKVTIPSGTLPLYNAKVFIPAGTSLPGAPNTGASCDRCDSVTDAVTSTTTDYNGNFTLTGVPSGQNIPIVIRVGKWQRIITVADMAKGEPAIGDCTTTTVDAVKTRLPRNKTEGNIPKIALTTGGADALECLLRSKKLGIDDSEFTNPTGTGRVNLFAGSGGSASYDRTLNSGASFPAANTWWNDASNKLMGYDIVMFSCEGGQNPGDKSQQAHKNLENFLGAGGRVFASHWHNVWITDPNNNAGSLAQVATFLNSNTYTNDSTPITATINTGFAKGQNLSNWLMVNGSQPPKTPSLTINYSRVTLKSRNPTLTQSWIDFGSSAITNANSQLANPASQYFSFNTPVAAPAAMQCGQMVFTDIHVSGAPASSSTDASNTNLPFPTGCNSPTLSDQEKALIFMLFDLTNCLSPIIG
jgi:hypothetical protein